MLVIAIATLHGSINFTVIDMGITTTRSYGSITKMHCWVMQTRSNSQQKQFSEVFFFPTGTSYKIPNSRLSGYSDRYKNLWTRSASMNLSACCFYLGVTSIICHSCPQIVTKEKEDGSLWSREMCRLVRWRALETCLWDQSKWEGKLFQGREPQSLCFAFSCSICCIMGDNNVSVHGRRKI